MIGCSRTSFLACLWLRTCTKPVFVAWATLLVPPSINYATKGGGGVTSTTVMAFNGFRWCGSVNTKECWGRSPVVLCSHLQPSSDSCQMCGCSYPAPFVLPTSSLSYSLSLPLSLTYSPCVSVALHAPWFFPVLPFSSLLSTPSSAEVEGRVELYISPSGPSWPVLGWTLPFTFFLFCLCRVVYIPCFTNRYTMGYLQRLSID